MFNPINAKCDQVNPEYCRPGETVYIPSSLKELDLASLKESVKDYKPKVFFPLCTIMFKLFLINVLGSLLRHELGILQKRRWKICSRTHRPKVMYPRSLRFRQFRCREIVDQRIRRLGGFGQQ